MNLKLNKTNASYIEAAFNRALAGTAHEGKIQRLNDTIVFPDFMIIQMYYILKTLSAYECDLFSADVMLDGMDVLAKRFKYIKAIDKEKIPVVDYQSPNMKFDTLKHQYNVIGRYLHAKKNFQSDIFSLGAVVGSGKTFMALLISEYLKAKAVLIIAPKNTVQSVWTESLEGQDNLFYKNQDYYVIGSKDRYKQQKYIICSYENMKNLVREIPKKEYFLIVDEIHNFASKETSRTQELLKVLQVFNCEEGVIMSGTPIKGQVAEITKVLTITTPGVRDNLDFYETLYATNKPYIFKSAAIKQYKDMSHTILKEDMPKTGSTIVSVEVELPNWKEYTLDAIKLKVDDYIKTRLAYFDKNKAKYHSRYHKAVLKAKRASGIEMAKQFSWYTNEVAKIVTAEKDNKLHTIVLLLKPVNKFEKEHIIPHLTGEEKKSFRIDKSVYKYLSLKLRGEVLSNVVGKAREKAHVDMVEQLNIPAIINSATKKTLIFSKYIKVCEKVIDYHKLNRKYKTATIFGETTKDSATSISSFTRGKANPMIATYQSLSTGTRLTEASTTILIDSPFKQHTLTQVMGRTDRTGQDTPVTFFFLKLWTYEQYNINDRNIDIVGISNDAIKYLTGVSLTKLEAEKELTKDLEDREEAPITYAPDDILKTDFINEIKGPIAKLVDFFTKGSGSKDDQLGNVAELNAVLKNGEIIYK